ncbi:MAG: hypothetical protein HC831_05700 [Chloroflexia bacterium]|nr:hypothetical protein [Chloroflexia bacterium]
MKRYSKRFRAIALCALLLPVFLLQGLKAQETKIVSGTVTDQDGLPLPG